MNHQTNQTRDMLHLHSYPFQRQIHPEHRPSDEPQRVDQPGTHPGRNAPPPTPRTRQRAARMIPARSFAAVRRCTVGYGDRRTRTRAGAAAATSEARAGEKRRAERGEEEPSVRLESEALDGGVHRQILRCPHGRVGTQSGGWLRGGHGGARDGDKWVRGWGGFGVCAASPPPHRPSAPPFAPLQAPIHRCEVAPSSHQLPAARTCCHIGSPSASIPLRRIVGCA